MKKLELKVEEMAKTLCKCHFATCADCMRQSSTTAYRCDFIEKAKILSAAGYGNVKQAIKEAFNRLQEEMDKICTANTVNGIIAVDKLIKKFIKEICEEN